MKESVLLSSFSRLPLAFCFHTNLLESKTDTEQQHTEKNKLFIFLRPNIPEESTKLLTREMQLRWYKPY